jgi:autophagy-related protein 2
MSSWIPSSIQKRLLRYALNRSGLLDVTGIDLDNLDISWGRRTTLEFKEVNLNVEYLVGLAQLPPNLRLESARILSLRLTIPADIIGSGISVEVDGVDVVARLEETQEEEVQPWSHKASDRMPRGTQSPSHRKTSRRIQSPPFRAHGEARLPTTEDLAKSFLAEEPPEERRELEASVAVNTAPMDESVFSESSDGSDIGTGAAPGLPGFLSNWLQRVIDRFEMKIGRVHVSLELDGIAQNPEDNTPANLIAKLERVELLPGSNKREVRFGNFSIELVAHKQTLSDLSHITSPASPASPAASRAAKSSRHSEDILNRSFGDFFQQQPGNRHNDEPPTSDDGLTTSNTNPSPDEPASTSMLAESHDTLPNLGSLDASINDLGIQMGDDNISWTSRRSQGGRPIDDIWEGPTEDDMPASLLLGINQPLPQSQSSAASSSPTRSRRAMSPYDRGFHGPGSWPRMEESPQSSRDRVGPGSWPAPDQSQSDLFLSMTSDNNEEPADATDNKRNALEASTHQASLSPSLSTSVHSEDQGGLEQSRYFSHEEAQSMYMSAVATSKEPQIPGAWESEIASRVDLEPAPVASPDTDSLGSNDIEARTESPIPAHASEDCPSSLSEAATPRGHTPSPPTPIPHRDNLADNAELATLQLLFVDAITLFLPNQGGDGVASSPPTSAAPPDVSNNFASNRAASQSLSMSRAGMPGAFSTYAQLSSSQRRGVASIIAERETSASRYSKPAPTEKPTPMIEIQVGAVRLQADVPAAQLLYRIGDTLTSGSVAEKPDESRKQENSMELLLSVESLDIKLHEQLEQRLDQPLPHSVPGLLNLNTQQIRISSKPTQQNVRLGKLEFFLGGHKVLSFDQSTQALSESMIFEEDLRLLIDTSKFTTTSRPITNIGLESRPVHVDIDLNVFDDVFSTFGGLSGVLDIGNSMASDASPLASKVVPDRTQRVRFDDDAPVNETSTEYKANASVSGITFVICADQTTVALQTGSMKAVYREKAASVRFSGSVRLSGPYLNSDSIAPLQVDLAGLWIHYLFTPQEQDLERLLALITPSKDKYDNDDDILIETLLRQRRKGSCLRLTLDDAKIKIDDFESLNSLQALSTQVSRLSAVTKYLPEDERPGLLSLIRVKNVELQVPVNDRFGTLQTTFKELQCAHVGLPALLALSLSDVVVAQSGGPELVHALVPLSGSDDLPMIMARMLDDEVEPIVKVKLYNVCVEYSVPTLLDLTSSDHGVDAEELVADLAASVVDLASNQKNESHRVSTDSQPAKRTHLCLLVHNSAIGLTSQKSPSKGLLVLTDARASTTVPPSDTMNVTVELHQAGILVTDDVHAAHSEPSSSRRKAPESTVVDIRVLNALWKQGYASVGSIMSAVIDTRIEQASGGGASTVEVDVRNDFFLLETCADSTQTLTAVLGGLSPPAPPSKGQKYLTEPITIEDMISSFSGDAYAKPERPMETLFDVDEEPLVTESDFGDGPDDLLMDADMSSSLYGPVGGMIGDLDDGPSQADQDYGETVESLLEDDPFEMTISPDDMPFSDTALMRDLRQQALPAKSAEPVDLGNYEIEDLGFDALGVDEQALGTRYRFSAPTSRRIFGNKTTSGTKLPFKLRLRDVHATWHMHDGYDWQKTRDGITAAVEHVEQRAEERLARRRQARTEPEDEESTIGDCMFNSVYITVPNNLTETPDIRRGINRQIDDLVSESESAAGSGLSRPTHYSSGGRPIHAPNRRRLKLERSRYHKISFEVKGASVDMDVFPPDSGELQSSVDVRLKQFEIFDNVPTSTWKKFLTQQHAAGTQELARPMVHIQLLSQKTVQERDATDLMIHVAVQPLRLHVDQDALDFITRFTEFKDSTAEPPSPSDQPFLSRVEIDTVDLQLDYKPKKVDYVGLRSGLATEFMNFVILDQAHIRLRHAIVYGIRGFEPLHKTLNDVWMPDVKRNQLPTILTGLAPIRSLANIGTGVRDVVAIPIREYKKDGRIVRSVQKGAFQFGKTTASELARLGAKVAMGTQNILSGAEGLLAPQAQPSQAFADRANNPSDGDVDEDREHRAYSAYADQPLGVLAGLRSARRYLEHDLLTARDALIAVQGEILDSSNPGSAAMAVARHAPTVMLRPVIGATRAIGTTLLGVGNQIDRGGVKRMEDVSCSFSCVVYSFTGSMLTIFAEV